MTLILKNKGCTFFTIVLFNKEENLKETDELFHLINYQVLSRIDYFFIMVIKEK